MIEFLGEHLDDVGTLVFDAAGPAAMSLPAHVIPDLLELGGVDLADEPETSDATAVGFRLNLDSTWSVIDLADRANRDTQIRQLVARQTRTLGDRAAGLRRDMRARLTATVDQAARAGGAQLGFLTARTHDAAAALNVTSYFHDLGMPGGRSQLDRISEHLRNQGDPDDVVDMEMAGEHLLRHTRVKHGDNSVAGDNSVGGTDVALLLLDYWLAAPDHRHVAHVSFSTPHVAARDAMTLLADNVVLNGSWVLADVERQVGDVASG